MSNTGIVKLLLKQGVDVNAKDEESIIPLHEAVCTNFNNSEIVKLLLENGAEINVKDNWNRTPLYMKLFFPYNNCFSKSLFKCKYIFNLKTKTLNVTDLLLI